MEVDEEQKDSHIMERPVSASPERHTARPYCIMTKLGEVATAQARSNFKVQVEQDPQAEEDIVDGGCLDASGIIRGLSRRLSSRISLLKS